MSHSVKPVERTIERLTRDVVVAPSGCWTWVGPRLWNGAHYERAHRYSFIAHGGTLATTDLLGQLCGNGGCVNPAHLSVVGRPGRPRPPASDRSIERIANNVDVLESGCWEWRGHRNVDGYGRVSHMNRSEPVHRYSFLAHGGSMRPGQQILHSCDNPPCCNPEHLRAGTNAENMRDKVERNRQARGEANGNTTLTEAQVVAIRERFAAGELQRELGVEFGVSQTVVSTIVRGKWWSHVGGPITHTSGRRPSKLSAQDCRALVALVAGGVSQRRAADHFGVSNQLVSDIVNGKKRKVAA